ncbi:MAG: hypothetical protein M1819_006860 [Sarea resinae]|nr:MAG: hypothetical protein M1819_006860 [Sarea resinae]
MATREKGPHGADLNDPASLMEKAKEEEEKEEQRKQQVAPDPLDQALAFLSSGDDTTKFVGLAILKPLLDNKSSLLHSPEVISKAWNAIPAKFLERLLRAQQASKGGAGREGKSKEEASAMVSLAVGVIHTFAVLLPPEEMEGGKMSRLVDGLVGALTRSSTESSTQILQTLISFCSHAKGASALLAISDLSPLLELVSQNALALDVVKYALINHHSAAPTVSELTENSDSSARVDKIISALVLGFRGEKEEIRALFDTLTDVLSRTSLPQAPSTPPSWLPRLTTEIRSTLQNRPTRANIKSATLLSACLLSTYPASFPRLLFQSTASSPATRDSASNGPSKPFPYILITLLNIDIRATMPSLLEILASNPAQYQEETRSLAAGYDILTTFIRALVESLDTSDLESGDDSDDNNEEAGLSSTDAEPALDLLPPDILLSLRKEIAETMSVTMEFVRDRWDALSAVPLSASSATSTTISSSSAAAGPTTPLLTAASSAQSPEQPQPPPLQNDILFLSALPALSLWLHEDDNALLRHEASTNLTEILLYLYGGSSSSNNNNSGITGPFGSLTLALSAILESAEGQAAFHAFDGAGVLIEDLTHLINDLPSAHPTSSSSSSSPSSPSSSEENAPASSSTGLPSTPTPPPPLSQSQPRSSSYEQHLRTASAQTLLSLLQKSIPTTTSTISTTSTTPPPPPASAIQTHLASLLKLHEKFLSLVPVVTTPVATASSGTTTSTTSSALPWALQETITRYARLCYSLLSLISPPSARPKYSDQIHGVVELVHRLRRLGLMVPYHRETAERETGEREHEHEGEDEEMEMEMEEELASLLQDFADLGF